MPLLMSPINICKINSIKTLILVGIFALSFCLVQCGDDAVDDDSSTDDDSESATFVSLSESLESELKSGEITNEEFVEQYLSILNDIDSAEDGASNLKIYLEESVLGYSFSLFESSSSLNNLEASVDDDVNVIDDLQKSPSYRVLEAFRKNIDFASSDESENPLSTVCAQSTVLDLSTIQMRTQILTALSDGKINSATADDFFDELGNGNPFDVEIDLLTLLEKEIPPRLEGAPKEGDCLIGCRPIHGLVDMGIISFYNNTESTNKADKTPVNDPTVLQPYVGSFTGFVINVTWEQLQPDGRGSIRVDNPLIDALNALQLYNKKNPCSHLSAKLRVWGGFTAPKWAKSIGGDPIAVSPVSGQPPNQKTQNGTIGRFWSEEYLDAWKDLQRELVLLLNGDPRNRILNTVVNTSCMSNTDEVMVNWLDTDTITKLREHGYTDEKQKACVSGSLDHYTAWENKFIDFPFSLFHSTYNHEEQKIDVRPDNDFTVKVMKQCAEDSKCIMSNHALNSPRTSADDLIYTKMADLHEKHPKTAHIDFQTVSPALLVSWCSVIYNAVKLHGRSVELWPLTNKGGFTELESDEVAGLAKAVVDQTKPEPQTCPEILDVTPPPASFCTNSQVVLNPAEAPTCYVCNSTMEVICGPSTPTWGDFTCYELNDPDGSRSLCNYCPSQWSEDCCPFCS